MNCRIGLVALLLLGGGLISCSDEGRSYAGRVQSPMELIGGPGALGAVGDYLLANDSVRVIIQDKGWSRGFGVFGGGIIDADIVRPGTTASPNGGTGKDNFGESFPAFFLQAFDVENQTIRNDGCGGYCPMAQACVVDEAGVTACLPVAEGCAGCVGSNECVAVDEEATQCLALAEADALDAQGVEVISDGSDGGAAIIRTRSKGGNFLTLINFLLEFAIPQDAGLRYETDYILKPGARHVEIVGRLVNDSGRPVKFNGEALAGVLGADDIQIPMGDVLLFGGGNSVFSSGSVTRSTQPDNPKVAGFDLRYTVEASYNIQRENGVSLPALQGLVTDFLATRGDGVSYGFAIAPNENNYAYMNKDQYEKDPLVNVSAESFVIPFLFSSFTGAYYAVPPAELAPHEAWEYTRYLMIGDGDVGSIRNELYNIRNTKTASFSGEVRDAVTGEPVHEGMVHIFDELKRPYSQVDVSHGGSFVAKLPDGDYYWQVTGHGRDPYPSTDERFTDFNKFTIQVEVDSEGGTTRKDAFKRIRVPSTGHYDVEVRDEAGTLLPAKVSFVAPYTLPERCTDCERLELDCDLECAPRSYLFDFSLGEDRRSTDLNWNDGQNGEYLEEIAYTVDGQVRGTIRPGTYDVYVSRGLEYDLSITKGVVVAGGKRASLSVVLNRSVNTADYIGADLHLHSSGSLDSSMSSENRVLSSAAEGLEYAVSTDHNFITDYEPAIVSLGLEDWIKSMVGVEVSTLEMGHFNAFPLRYDVGAASHFPFVEFCYEPRSDKSNETAFDWVECKPDQIFDHVRQLGRYHYDSTIVQANHPRDSVLGYFSQYYMNPYTGVPEENPSDDNYSLSSLIYPQNSITGQFKRENFSYEFDAIEVFNGKRFDQLHGWRLPTGLDESFYASKQAYECDGDSGHPLNGPGMPLLQHGGHIAYPGAVDDWMNLLNRGIKVTATGNSDSHSGHEEVGFPRNYIYITPDADTGTPRDEPPTKVHDLDIVDGLKEHQAIATNGPFVKLSVVSRNDAGEVTYAYRVGQTVNYTASNAGRNVEIQIEVNSADWIDVDRLVLWANGEIIETIEIADEVGASGRATDDKMLVTRVKQFDVDTWIALEAYGSNNLFPVVVPKEDPPSNISDALEGLVGGLGLDPSAFGGGDGLSGPNPLQRAIPYALTNPIFLDIDASGRFEALYEGARLADAPPGPGAAPGSIPGWDCGDEKTGVKTMTRGEYRTKVLHKQTDAGRRYQRNDIRRIFDAMHPH
ncbi:MAG: hypothetical protein HOI23_11375 [Deltaproteobacteria bacterium]|nr:hypothetical protein [Deltaproteobacteria bacterium]MBT6433236.1 hypothetical protein [Deltaproteobacteria bacterium]